MKLKNILLIFCALLTAQSLFAQNPFEHAKFIAPAFSEDTVNRPCLVFSRMLKLTKPVRSAKLYISALGLYEANLNGLKIGKDYFTPGFTNYHKRLQYQCYDISGQLKKDNRFEVTVAEGWYRGTFRGPKPRDNFGSIGALIFALELTYSDGEQAYLYSDEDWSVSTSAIRYSSLYNGEFRDANFNAPLAEKVKVIEQDKSILIPTETLPVRAHERFKGEVFYSTNGDQLIDFSQNLAGWVEMKVKGKKGDTIRISHGEVLDAKGNLFTANLRSAKAQDIYVLKGGDEEVLVPHFTYHGFRYAKIEWKRDRYLLNLSKQPFKAQAVALYSELKPTGTFSCSDPKLNQLQSNILWSMKSNFVDIPTDCPQRSERLGWTEDADVFCSTASYLLDVKDFYKKWLNDLSATQGSDGSVPVTIPDAYGKRNGSISGWSDAATFTPWTLFEKYGDTSILSKQYSSMKAWVDYVKSVSPNMFWSAGGYGDWYPMGAKTDLGYLNMCYWYRSTSTLVKAARVLGKKEDIEKYSKLAAQIKSAFKLYFPKVPDTQTAYVVGIYFGLLDAAELSNLIWLLEKSKFHLSTGFMGTPYLLHVLVKYGRADVAYKILFQNDKPSWLYMVEKGATTMWEMWDAVKEDGSFAKNGDVSLNHYAFGSVGSFLYEHVAGISPLLPGYKKIKIAPQITSRLSWAKGSYKSGFGTISSEWRRTGKKVILKVQIPENTTAEIVLPGSDIKSVGPGSYTFKTILPH